MRWKTKDKTYGIQKPVQHFVSRPPPIPSWYLPRHTSTYFTWYTILFPHNCGVFSSAFAFLSTAILILWHFNPSLFSFLAQFPFPTPTLFPSPKLSRHSSLPSPRLTLQLLKRFDPLRNARTTLVRWRRSAVPMISTTRATRPAPRLPSHPVVGSAAVLQVALPQLMPARLWAMKIAVSQVRDWNIYFLF